VPLSCGYVPVRIDPCGLVVPLSLTMITCGCGLERAEGPAINSCGRGSDRLREVGRWGALGSARGQPGAARCGHNWVRWVLGLDLHQHPVDPV
jgi:hypothetical protein